MSEWCYTTVGSKYIGHDCLVRWCDILQHDSTIVTLQLLHANINHVHMPAYCLTMDLVAPPIKVSNGTVFTKYAVTDVEFKGCVKFDIQFTVHGTPQIAVTYLESLTTACATYFRETSAFSVAKNVKCFNESNPFQVYVRLLYVKMNDGTSKLYTLVNDVACLKLMNVITMSQFLKSNIMPSELLKQSIPGIYSGMKVTLMSMKAFRLCLSHRRPRCPNLNVLDEYFSHRVCDILYESSCKPHFETAIQTANLERQCIDYKANIRSVSNPIILHYMEKEEFRQNPKEFVKLCASFHNPVVSSVIIGLQQAINTYVGTYVKDQQRHIAKHVLESIFHVNCSDGYTFLTGQLRYRIGMYVIICEIMNRNRLLCSQKITSTHAPLPLMALILMRVKHLNISGFDYMGYVGGIMHQLEAMAEEMGMDREQLEKEYKMDELSLPIHIQFQQQERNNTGQMSINDFY